MRTILSLIVPNAQQPPLLFQLDAPPLLPPQYYILKQGAHIMHPPSFNATSKTLTSCPPSPFLSSAPPFPLPDPSLSSPALSLPYSSPFGPLHFSSPFLAISPSTFPCNLNSSEKPPGPCLTSLTFHQAAIWQQYVAYEASNPQQLEKAGLQGRVTLAFDQALMFMYHMPEFWYEAAVWHVTNPLGGGVHQAGTIFHRARMALPGCSMLRFVAAEVEEAAALVAKEKGEEVSDARITSTGSPACLVQIRRPIPPSNARPLLSLILRHAIVCGRPRASQLPVLSSMPSPVQLR